MKRTKPPNTQGTVSCDCQSKANVHTRTRGHKAPYLHFSRGLVRFRDRGLQLGQSKYSSRNQDDSDISAKVLSLIRDKVYNRAAMQKQQSEGTFAQVNTCQHYCSVNVSEQNGGR